MMNDIENRLANIFIKLFGIEKLTEISRQNSSEWDSLKHIELILELEDEFSIELTDKQSMEINNFDSCLRTISEAI